MELISIIGAVLGVAGLLGFAAAYFRGSRSKAIIELQEKEIGALEGSNARLEKENAQCSAKNEAYERQLDTLKGLVQQTPAVIKLATDGKKNHDQVVKLLKRALSGK